MKSVELPLHELGVIGVTRAAAGAGLALLLADKLDAQERRAAGWVLFGIGVLTSVPLAVSVLRRIRDANRD